MTPSQFVNHLAQVRSRRHAYDEYLRHQLTPNHVPLPTLLDPMRRAYQAVHEDAFEIELSLEACRQGVLQYERLQQLNDQHNLMMAQMIQGALSFGDYDVEGDLDQDSESDDNPHAAARPQVSRLSIGTRRTHAQPSAESGHLGDDEAVRRTPADARAANARSLRRLG